MTVNLKMINTIFHFLIRHSTSWSESWFVWWGSLPSNLRGRRGFVCNTISLFTLYPQIYCNGSLPLLLPTSSVNTHPREMAQGKIVTDFCSLHAKCLTVTHQSCSKLVGVRQTGEGMEPATETQKIEMVYNHLRFQKVRHGNELGDSEQPANTCWPIQLII